MSYNTSKNFIVKLCPKCGQAWERGHDKSYYHGRDFPMKSKLQKRICTNCKVKENLEL